jgi:hypothetical protein
MSNATLSATHKLTEKQQANAVGLPSNTLNHFSEEILGSDYVSSWFYGLEAF